MHCQQIVKERSWSRPGAKEQDVRSLPKAVVSFYNENESLQVRDWVIGQEFGYRSRVMEVPLSPGAALRLRRSLIGSTGASRSLSATGGNADGSRGIHSNFAEPLFRATMG